MNRLVIVAITLAVIAIVVPKAVADESLEQVAYYSYFVGEWRPRRRVVRRKEHSW